MLTKRLESIYNLVDNNAITLDVGCDHGLLSISLAKNKIVKTAYVSDINKNALEMAKKNIIKYNIDNVFPYLGNGTAVECINKINTLIISGMGSENIISILNRDKNVLPKTIILCSNNKYDLLRRYLSNIGYYIHKEIIVKDRNKFYISIKFVKEPTNKKQNFYIPNCIKDDIFYEYINYSIKKKIQVLTSIPKRCILKRYKLKRLIKLYKKASK